MQQEIIEVKGTTIEIATRIGLEKLKLPRERVEVEVLDAGSRGLLGIGSRDAVVRLKVRPTIQEIIRQDYGQPEEKPAAVVKKERVASTQAPKTAVKKQEVAKSNVKEVKPEPVKAAPVKEKKPKKVVIEAAPPVKEKAKRPTRAPKEKKRATTKENQQKKKSDDWDQPPTDLAGLQAELEMAILVVGTLLEKMDIKVAISGEITDPSDERDQQIVVVHVTGEDLGNVIGEGGETVNDLQYLARLIASHELHYRTKFVIDIDGYRERRRQALTRLAERMAEKVVKQNRSLALEPMPPYERRVVHLTLRQDERVETNSIGHGDRRRVRIFPKKDFSDN